MKAKIEKVGILLLFTFCLFLISTVLFKRIDDVTTPDKLLHLGVGIVIAAIASISLTKTKIHIGFIFGITLLGVLIFEFLNDYSIHRGTDAIAFYQHGDEMIDVYSTLFGAFITFVFLEADIE